jgi:hypothetical protein
MSNLRFSPTPVADRIWDGRKLGFGFRRNEPKCTHSAGSGYAMHKCCRDKSLAISPQLLSSHPHLSDEVNRNIVQSEIEGGVSLHDLTPQSVQHRIRTLVLLAEQNLLFCTQANGICCRACRGNWAGTGNSGSGCTRPGLRSVLIKYWAVRAHPLHAWEELLKHQTLTTWQLDWNPAIREFLLQRPG